MRGFFASGFAKSGFFTLLVAALLAGAGSQARAQELPLGAFYGHFQGAGVAENQDSLYFGVTVRDIDVRIAPAGGTSDGFTVEWTSVIRGGGNPDKPDIRRKHQKITFRPGDRPNIYRAEGAQNSTEESTDESLVWARIQGRTLSVNVMRIDEDGGYIVQTYDRTLESTGMRLRYISVSDGEPNRVVEARLVKIGN